MSIFLYIFIVIAFVISNLFQSVNTISIETQVITAAFFILLIGIPHGSLDHILLPRRGLKCKIKFYTFYVGLILFNLLIWHYNQFIGLTIFILISSYHFGEVQLFPIDIRNKLLTHLTYLIWGSSVLFTFIFYNMSEFINLSYMYADIQNIITYFDLDSFIYLFYFTNVITVVLLLSFVLFFGVKPSLVISEVFFLFVMHLSSFLFPLIICFTLFFIVLHALPSLSNQYNYFKSTNDKFSLKRFIILMAPYSLVSVFFILFICFCSHMEFIDYSIPLISLILISVITLPHSFIISKFNNFLTSFNN